MYFVKFYVVILYICYSVKQGNILFLMLLEFVSYSEDELNYHYKVI